MMNHRKTLLVALLSVLFAALSGCPKSPVGRLSVDGGFPDADTAEPDTSGGQGGFALCDPCVSDETCLEGVCVPLAEGNFCLEPCGALGLCPEGFACGDLDGEEFCLPPSGTCACREDQAGDQVACARSNEFGECIGMAVCDPATGWVCGAQVPAAEVCDYEDNNCDGNVDEDFLLGEWYFGPENCGECGIVCDNEIANGTGYCSLAPPPPTCRVSACDPGYYSPDGLTCVLQVGDACTPCTTDEDCIGGRCFVLEGGSYCLPECLDACPEHYECQEQADGSWCFPLTGSCECTPEAAGELVRSCQITNEFGTCPGFELCTETGWGLCDATIPAPEDCNGYDDNCNGVADENLSGIEPCVNTVPGVGSCPGLLQCEGEAGYVCDAPTPEVEVCDYQDNNCDNVVDDGFIDAQTGLYTLDAWCGGCANDCTVLDAPHAVYQCLVDGGNPACGMVCVEGWVDLNELEDDGCECEFISADDPPDGIDQNCDGIDGDPANAVFVSPTGKDINPGTPEAPVRTISMGLQRSEENNKGHIYVAAGYYKEIVKLREGKQVFGGFADDFSVRDVDQYTCSLEPPADLSLNLPQATVTGLKVGQQKSSFEGFVVLGPYVQEPGRSSYAVYLKNCGPQLAIRDNTILAGDGGDGEEGDDGNDGQDGTPGQNGQPAYDVGNANCGGQSPGGAGGQLACGGTALHGGTGGHAICPDFDEWAPGSQCPVVENQTTTNLELGGDGKPLGPGGNGGQPGGDAIQTRLYDGKVCAPDVLNCQYCHISLWGTDGMMGGAGNPGTNGGGGTGCANTAGQVVTGEWQAIGGGAGAAGTPGAGGGGGGAGGGIETYQCNEVIGGHDMGGSGGGGGSGGCAGSAGTGGTGGGGSFGLFLFWTNGATTAPLLENNQVDTGFGGIGGAGGKAGVGGSGGWGGAGGPGGEGSELTWCAGAGGEGGHGGNGGAGGGGGGGCGGVAMGIFVGGGPDAAYKQQVKSLNTVNLAGSGGLGGKAGSSKGQPGDNGSSGNHAAMNF